MVGLRNRSASCKGGVDAELNRPSQGKRNDGGKVHDALVFYACCAIAFSVVFILLWLGYSLFQALLIVILLQVVALLLIVNVRVYRDSERAFVERSSKIAGYNTTEDPPVWQSFSDIQSSDEVRSVALIAPDTAHTKNIARELMRQGLDIHQTTDIEAMLWVVQAHRDDLGYIILDIDLLDDLDEMVMKLMTFRSSCPNMPLLLLSSSVRQDEFFTYRRAIGDVTLRKPVSTSRLLVGIDIMKKNFQVGVSAKKLG